MKCELDIVCVHVGSWLQDTFWESVQNCTSVCVRLRANNEIPANNVIIWAILNVIKPIT